MEHNIVSARDTLAAVIEKETGCTKTASKAAVGKLFETIVKSTKKEGKISLPGFGTFLVAKRAARNGVNPKTGAPLKIKARKTMRFKPAATLRDL